MEYEWEEEGEKERGEENKVLKKYKEVKKWKTMRRRRMRRNG